MLVAQGTGQTGKDMLAEFGFGVLLISFITTIYSGAAAFYGAQNKSGGERTSRCC